MYIKKQVKEEIYAMYLNGIPIEDIAENKEIKVSDAEKAIAEWEATLLKELNPYKARGTFFKLLQKETIAKAVCDTADEIGRTRDIVEKVLGFQYPIVTVKRVEDRDLIHAWNGLYTYCQCVKQGKAEEARRYYAICQG